MKIALLHDSFTQMGGAERVVDGLHEIFPKAPVFTLVFDPKYKEKYKNWDIRTSALQPLYLLLGKLKFLLPLVPWAVEQIDLSGYDVIVSSSSGLIKNVKPPKNSVYICYCHTPPRFLGSDYVTQEVPFLLRPLAKFFLKYYKRWDIKATARINFFVANSEEVKRRIKNSYNRQALVVYPGISSFWRPSAHKSDYFLLAGRLQAHKQNEVIIRIFSKLNIDLHVVGSGRQEEYLRSIAGPSVKFLGRVSDEVLRNEYSGAKAYIFPQVEDFGLMPLEAAACGTPTLAYGRGGALETVIPKVTGEFFYSYDEEEVKNLILNWQPEKYTIANLQRQAEKFKVESFKKTVGEFVSSRI